MKKILILQFRIGETILCDEIRAFQNIFKNAPVEIVCKNAFLDTLSWSNPASILENAQGIILGGSGEFDFDGGRVATDESKIASHALVREMTPFLKYLTATDFPTLGICFGHQILARSLGVPVTNDESQAKVGSHEVFLTDAARKDSLFKDLPDHFVAHYGHKDSVALLPPGATLLASGEKCAYSALRFGERRYSVQFHPELTREDVLLRCAANSNYLPQDFSPRTQPQDSPYANKLLENFVNNIVQV